MKEYRKQGPAIFNQAAAKLFAELKVDFQKDYGLSHGTKVFLPTEDITAAVATVKAKLSEVYASVVKKQES